MGELFERTYPQILVSAKLITRRRNSNPRDLINTTYLYLSKNDTYPFEPIQFTKWFVKVMKILHDKPKSSFNAMAVSSAKELVYDPVDLSEEAEEYKQEEAEAPSHLKSERADQFVKLSKFKKTLPLHEQFMFDLYFFGGMSCMEITKQLNAEGYNIRWHGVKAMIRSIKDKMEVQTW